MSIDTTLVGVFRPSPTYHKKLHTPKCSICKEDSDNYRLSLMNAKNKIIRICSENCFTYYKKALQIKTLTVNVTNENDLKVEEAT